MSTPKSEGQILMYTVFGLVVQTFFFGVYTLLMSLSSRMLLKRGLKTRTNWVMFLITLFMYILSALYYGYSVTYAVDSMHTYIHDAPLNLVNPSPAHNETTKWSPVFNAIVLVNYILSDGIVCWRAWLIGQRTFRKYLWFAIAFLVLTAVAVFLTIGFRITAYIQSPIGNLPDGFLKQGIDILQISVAGCSIMSNLIATLVVGATAWRHRRIMRSAFKDGTTRADKILALVVESGVFYCISTVTVLLASLWRLPHGGTLGDLYLPIHLYIAGAYPSIVILLVSMKRPLNESTFSDALTSDFAPSEGIIFGSAYTSPTSTVGGPESMHPKRNMTLEQKRARSLSRFSDDSGL
ncbi:hypothetical protein DFH09DRAFT_212861 [Mycena vulgaris]|nr:hypothetical protein DFH09DRAFT_212861 [Mycena vulgaris]